MNEWEQSIIELNAADCILLMALKKKLSVDGNPELRRVLRSVLAMQGPGAGSQTKNSRPPLKGRGSLLVFPLRGVRQIKEKSGGEDHLAGIGEPPAF